MPPAATGAGSAIFLIVKNGVGVIATPDGEPRTFTLIVGPPASGTTVIDPAVLFATTAFVESGVIAMPAGLLPTVAVARTVLTPVSMMVAVPS